VRQGKNRFARHVGTCKQRILGAVLKAFSKICSTFFLSHILVAPHDAVLYRQDAQRTRLVLYRRGAGNLFSVVSVRRDVCETRRYAALARIGAPSPQSRAKSEPKSSHAQQRIILLYSGCCHCCGHCTLCLLIRVERRAPFFHWQCLLLPCLRNRLAFILTGIFSLPGFVAVLFVKRTRALQSETFAPGRANLALDD